MTYNENEYEKLYICATESLCCTAESNILKTLILYENTNKTPQLLPGPIPQLYTKCSKD